MKTVLFCALVLFNSQLLFSQDTAKFNLYKPAENAEKEIAHAVKEAKAQNKHVMIQTGGNWCIWCIRFNDFVKTDKQLDSMIKADYIVYHLNYSKENYNVKLMAKYNYPQRFGFPVFLILNDEGKLIHTQNSWYLEDGKKSYDKEKVTAFFKDWTTKAFDPKNYKQQ